MVLKRITKDIITLFTILICILRFILLGMILVFILSMYQIYSNLKKYINQKYKYKS